MQIYINQAMIPQRPARPKSDLVIGDVPNDYSHLPAEKKRP